MTDRNPSPSAPAERFQSFEEFYPYYLSEHANPVCRALHYLGTSIGFGFLAAGVFLSPWWLIGLPLSGYFFAWTGHFFIEKNRPATFSYPLWSLIGDYKMYFSWLSGRLPAQLAAAGVNGVPETARQG